MVNIYYQCYYILFMGTKKCKNCDVSEKHFIKISIQSKEGKVCTGNINLRIEELKCFTSIRAFEIILI